MNKMIEEKVKPKVELIKTNVVVNTSNAKELTDLMKICELNKKINWSSKESPIKGAYVEQMLAEYGRNTCINLNDGKYLSWDPKRIYKNTFLLEEFCEMNNITPEKLNEINNYFK